jgi:hypothetical protein
MGTTYSSKKTRQLQPAREPAALLETSTGVILRTQNPTSGEFEYVHSPRDIPRNQLIKNASSANAAEKIRVPLVRAGNGNAQMKKKVMYVTKKRRSGDT